MNNTPERIKDLESHSIMLGQIACLVSDYCATEETTTLEAVQALIEDKDSETRWANHYCRKLVEAQKAGYLPDDFKF